MLPSKRPTRWIVALVICSLVLAVACRRPAGLAPRRQPDLNVLLITVDTLRADAVGAYGNPRAATPSIDRLAAGGVRFADAHAHNVTTLPSHANILSGTSPLDHGVRDNAGFRVPATIDTLATRLKGRGYRTGAFISAFPLDSRFGLDRGFDVYEDSFVDAQPRPAFLEQERRGSDTVALAGRWIDSGPANQPYFCWVHLYEPHFPYAPPEPFRSRFLNDPYLGEVAAADAALAPLLDPITAAGRDGPATLVVLTADHGESLGDHGEATHGIFAYEATLAVPLIVFQPRLYEPRVSRATARHVDLLPTILDILAIDANGSWSGRSLLPALAGGESDDPPIYFEAMSGNLNRGWAPLRGVIRNRTKFIDLPIPELYDLERDPEERHNLADAASPRVDEMRALLGTMRSREAAPVRRADTADTRERLRSLGYANALTPPAARYTESDDPKRLIALDALLQDVVQRYLAGDLQGAIARCRELIERRPTMAVALLELAHLERERGNLPAAIDALRRAAALNPADSQTMSLLAASLTQAGRAAEAVDLLEPYSRGDSPDPQVISTRALALAAAGRPDAALAALAEARQRDPANAMIYVESGTVSLMAGDRRRARAEFEAALKLNRYVARAHSSLAIMAAEEGRSDEAVAHWKEALTADPREAGKLLAFAEFVRRRRPPRDARPYFELFAAAAPPAQYTREIDQARRWLAHAQ